MKDLKQIRLTSSEICNLWNTYMNDSMASKVLQYYLTFVKNEQIRDVVQNALAISEKHLNIIKEIYLQEQHVVPFAFSEKDINLNAPALYTEEFVLDYVYEMSRIGIQSYSICLAYSSRVDIRSFFSSCLNETDILLNKSVDLLQSKGLYRRAPYLPAAEEIEFVKGRSILADVFGEKRPLNVLEITQLHVNIETNQLGKNLLMGFAQVAESEKVKDFMLEGKEISRKKIEIYGEILMENDLPVPMSSDMSVTNSIVPPFSDKLMMYHVIALISTGIRNLGVSIATSLRKDLTVHYTRMVTESGAFSQKGVNIMIENNWFESPPKAPDRNKLANE